MDDRRARRDPFRDPAAGGRHHGRFSCGSICRAGQDAGALVRDFKHADLPRLVTPGGVAATVIAARARRQRCRDARGHFTSLLDLHLPAGARFEQPLPRGTMLRLCVRGSVTIGDNRAVQRMAILANDPQADGVAIEAAAMPCPRAVDRRRPLGEPIAQYGRSS